MKAWWGSGGPPQEIFENGNSETCSRGPCETLNVKSEESSIIRLTIFGRKKYKKKYLPLKKSIKNYKK